MSARKHADAETMVRDTGARTTRPRVAILAVLLAAERALSHNEVERRVNSAFGIDRVTVYRVLDWLSGQGLAHKIAGHPSMIRRRLRVRRRGRASKCARSRSSSARRRFLPAERDRLRPGATGGT